MVFSGVGVTWSLVLYACCVDRCLSLCPLFCHCVVCPSSIYGFWLPLWYLQTLLRGTTFVEGYHVYHYVRKYEYKLCIICLLHTDRFENVFMMIKVQSCSHTGCPWLLGYRQKQIKNTMQHLIHLILIRSKYTHVLRR